jgi:branched-subunit amino acid transport protein
VATAVTFGSRPAHVRFVVDKLALGQVIPSLLRYSPVGVFSSLLRTLLRIAVALTGMTEGRSEALLTSGALDDSVHSLSCSIGSSNLPQ